MCVVPVRGRSAARLCLVLVCSAPVFAQEPPGWRSWTPADGTQESYTRTLGVEPNGGVTLRHGVIPKMDLLDGYVVTSIPEARQGIESGFETAQPAYALSRERAWTVEERALKQLTDGRWVIRTRQAEGERLIAALPADGRTVLVLYHDRLMELDAPVDRWRRLVNAKDASLGEFHAMLGGFAGEVWVAAERGVGKLDVPSGRWVSYPARGLRHFVSPHPADGGELLVVAKRTRDRANVVLSLRGSRWETLYASRKALRGWRGADGDLWVLEGATIWRVNSAGKEAVAKRGPLSGVVYDVATQPGGVFWIASSTGVARYAPPLWRTPAPVAHVDQPVHAITEDSRGRLWFAATEYLLELDGATWRIHPLPDEVKTQVSQTASIAALADGRIALTALEPGPRQRLLAFDPRTRRYARIDHPEGRELVYLWNGPANRAWILTKGPCALQTWDGRTFASIPGLRLEPLCERIRYLHASSDRSMWVGTTALGGGVYRVGSDRLDVFDKSSGYPEMAVYTIFEHRPGRILAGGRDALAEFDGGRWQVLRTGLDAVRSMIRSVDGVLWVASGSGVHRQLGESWVTNGEADGLRSDTAYKIFQDRSGRIWAGTSRGVSRYHPERDLEPPRASLAASNSAETPPGGSVTIDFHGVDRWKYTSADRLLFSYRVDNGGWTGFRSSATAVFSDLASGTHRFDVRAMDRNGNIGPDTGFTFAVAYPWYQQPGFYAITAASLATISMLIGLATKQYRELARAKRAAESASRAKTEFLANMSHEIRTPINAIMGMTDLAAEMAVNAEQREYLRTVQTASGSLLALLNDILDLSKVEAGKLPLACDNFDVHTCVDDSVSTLKLRAAEKDLTLEAFIAPDVPTYVRGDDLRLRQILLNLLGNAIKFTERGGVSLRVTTEAQAGEALVLRFTVADTGIGLPADKQRIIFAAFEQADESTTRRYGGTGLGLAISQRLVGLMGGRIWVESPWTDAKGDQVTGTAFHFTAQLARGAKPESSSAPVDLVRPMEPLRVLVAEDNPVNQTLTGRMLQKLGHTVVLASNGEEAVRAFAAEAFDLVLMDVQMPVMDGFAATAAIRAHEMGGNRHTPIVALTAHALQGYREHCLEAGMDDYVTKPVKLDQLALAIARVVGSPLSRPATPADPARKAS